MHSNIFRRKKRFNWNGTWYMLVFEEHHNKSIIWLHWRDSPLFLWPVSIHGARCYSHWQPNLSRVDDVWTASMIPPDNLILHRLMLTHNILAYRVRYSLCPRYPQCSWSHESNSHLESNIFIDLWPSFLSPSPHCAAQPPAKVYFTHFSS